MSKLLKVKNKMLKEGKLDTKHSNEDLILRQQANKIKHKYIIRYDSKYKMLWDGLIIILAIFNGIIVPFSLAFRPPFYYSGGYIAWQVIIDICFLADILVNFRTSTANILTG